MVINDEPIDPGELSSFLRSTDEKFNPLFSYGFHTRTGLHTDPELRAGGRLVWVENPRTLHLVPLILKAGELNIDNEDKDTLEDDGEVRTNDNILPPPLDDFEESTNLRGPQKNMSATDEDDGTGDNDGSVAMFVRVFFLFCQGLFSGFCFSTFYLQKITNSGSSTDGLSGDELFITVYRPSSQEYRRLLYILASCSVVGSFNNCLHILSIRKSMAVNSPSFPKVLSDGRSSENDLPLVASATLLHGAAFLLTVIMSYMDVRISLSTLSSLDDNKFNSGLQQWKSMNWARLACAFVGWICCCCLFWVDLSTLMRTDERLLRVHEALEEWRLRVAAFEGEQVGLRRLGERALKKLVALQQMGLERTQDALDAVI